ncbi:MAG: hypothetical protein E3J71_02055 [Candidatus Stahlbacteria bacterium]|nr:MAG: hypothetical protein E3J71_02055 [Candidatus Stahlbacteria bacterium]
MKKALSLGLLLIGMLAFSHAQANLVDIGINLGRDYVVNYVIGPVTYWSQPTITASPFHVGLVFAVSPVKGFKLGVRGGYSNKILTRGFNSVSDYLDSWEEEITIHGGMGEFRILGETPIGGELAFLYGGLGLGYYDYYVEYSSVVYGEEQTSEYSESKTVGWGQTFIAGAHVGIVKWFGFNVEVEKLGWQSLEHTVDKIIMDDEDIGKYEKSYEPLSGLGDIGISVALVFKI